MAETNAMRVPQHKLQEFLKDIGDGSISMDCAVVPTKIKDVFTVTTTDFFYPLVEDPYMQGRIGCANVLSDLYAMGVEDCDTMLMILAASREMPEDLRDIVTREMIRGFNDLAKEAGTKVTGGQTVLNPWPIIGGVAISVCHKSDFITPEHAQDGDVLVLTKPLGTQVAVNAYQWMAKQNNHWNRIKDSISEEEVERAYRSAEKSMGRLNRTGARLMRKHNAHCGTDVTGFGILGHADNMAKAQEHNLRFDLHTLPIIAGMRATNDAVDNLFRLCNGYSAETSGGLLVAMTKADAAAFVREIGGEDGDGVPAWIIGNVRSSIGEEERGASIVEDFTVLEV